MNTVDRFWFETLKKILDSDFQQKFIRSSNDSHTHFTSAQLFLPEYNIRQITVHIDQSLEMAINRPVAYWRPCAACRLRRPCCSTDADAAADRPTGRDPVRSEQLLLLNVAGGAGGREFEADSGNTEDAGHHHHHHHEDREQQSGGHAQQHGGHSHVVPTSVASVAWMVIMGDGLHNFTDGLAIGSHLKLRHH